MDDFFQDQFYCDDDIFSFNVESLPPPGHPSAFVPYTNGSRIQVGSESIGDASNSRNAKKRMIEFLRRIQSAKLESRKPDRERGYQHMINERMRRERERQNYLALRSMLPIGTKNDKNSIIQVAAKRIQELEFYKEQLERSNNELEAKVGKNIHGGIKIGVRVVNPISGIDYMTEALKCLKKRGSRIRNIKSQFSDQKLTAVIDIEAETEVGDVELQNAVLGALEEVEQKLLVSVPGRLEKPNKKRLLLENENENENEACQSQFKSPRIRF